MIVYHPDRLMRQPRDLEELLRVSEERVPPQHDRRSARDMQRLREHLDIERWLLSGSSWGSTMLLAYAEPFPEPRFFPTEWQRFQAGVPPADRDGDLLTTYARLLGDPDPAVRMRAAVDWHAWEAGAARQTQFLQRPAPSRSAGRARICAHYFSHAAPGSLKATAVPAPTLRSGGGI